MSSDANAMSLRWSIVQYSRTAWRTVSGASWRRTGGWGMRNQIRMKVSAIVTANM